MRSFDRGLASGKAAVAAAAVIIASACHHSDPPVMAAPRPLPPQTSAPNLTPLPATQLAPISTDTARERHVDIDTHGAEVDVRSLLDWLAREGGFSVAYAPGVNRKVRVQLNDVPVSVALKTLLALADLGVESDAGVQSSASTSVVFYLLPVNIDALSVEAIMKRFDVGRSVAELIVQSRINKP